MPWTLADQNTIMVIKLIEQPIDGRTDRLPTEPTHQIFQQSRVGNSNSFYNITYRTRTLKQ
ncbi:hypothetical protein T05_1746 [Trichinella murrelli]|uniref:Uncharacterized protein n=1 Tax=Trichinella murrelli TaxID=144512 RepID=A0A0V0U6Q3_9BILA|nr:hypothetical protein T05_1746 [Trichinella murrelli]